MDENGTGHDNKGHVKNERFSMNLHILLVRIFVRCSPLFI